MRGLVIALQFLTRLPGPRLTVSQDQFARSMRWFPAVGLVVAAIVVGGVWAGARLDPWTGALAGMLLWAGVTGALHLDGLGDIADAAGAAHKGREHLTSVLADPHVGSFAVVAIVLQLLAKLVLLHGLTETGAWGPLLLVPAVARLGPLVWTLTLPPLHDGLGARFRGAVGWSHVAVWGLALGGAALMVAPILLAALFLIPLWSLWLRSRIGGISGDGHGAGIEILESGLLLAVLIGARTA